MITGTLHEDVCTFVISLRILLRMKNMSGKSCRENQNTHFMFGNPPTPENLAVYETVWGNMVQPDRSQITWPNAA